MLQNIINEIFLLEQLFHMHSLIFAEYPTHHEQLKVQEAIRKKEKFQREHEEVRKTIMTKLIIKDIQKIIKKEENSFWCLVFQTSKFARLFFSFFPFYSQTHRTTTPPENIFINFSFWFDFSTRNYFA